MKLNNEKKGEIFILSESALWGLFPVITILSYRIVPPLIALGGSTLFAAIFFAFLLTIKNKWHELKEVTALKDILWGTFLLGVLYYLFSFFGLRYTSAGNAALVAMTEIFFSYLFFHVFRKDNLPTEHIFGAVLMIFGACIVLFPNIGKFHVGDILILVAAAIAPFGNFFQRRARKNVSSESIMFIRSIISALVIFILAFIFHNHFSFQGFSHAAPLFAINGVLLLGLAKELWIEGIHRISVVKANALNSIAPLLTLFYAWLFLQNIPTFWQLISFIPMFFGIIFLSKE